MKKDAVSRRTLLAASAGVAATPFVAGCLGSDENGSADDGRDPGGDVVEEELDSSAWEDVTEIELEGYTRNWVGVDPSMIAGITNPTLVLIEGNEYSLTWENADGAPHNIAIWDEDDAVVDGLSTRMVRDRGERQTLEFVATPEMHQYVCEPHRRLMIGYIHVVSG